MSLPLTGAGPSAPGAGAPTAPVLSVVSVVGTTVTLSFVVDETIGEGDYRQVQIQADGGDWSSTIVDDTAALTSGEAGASELEIDIPEPDAGTYEVRMRVREGSDGPWSNWSNVEEYEIEASAAPSYIHRGSNESTVSGHVQTYAVDVGDATYVLIACSVQNSDAGPSSVTYDGQALSQIVRAVGGGSTPVAFYGGVITGGSGARNAVVTWDSASFENKFMDVYSLHDLASTTAKASGEITGDTGVSVDAGDLLFEATRQGSTTTALWDGSSPTPSNSRVIGAGAAKLAVADWLAASTGTITVDLSSYGGSHCYVVFA